VRATNVGMHNAEVVRQVMDAGVSYRQLDYWVRRGAVAPTVGADGSGTHRIWSEHDVDVLCAIGNVYAAALAMGLTSQHVSVEFVGRLWKALHASDRYEVTVGAVTITVDLTEAMAAP
jgi:hypothetical protein